MDILAEVKAIQDQLANERVALDNERAALEADKLALKERIASVDKKTFETQEKLDELRTLEQKMDNFQMTQVEKDTLLELRKERASQAVAMKEWENKLFEIEANQKNENERLTKWSESLVEKEATYKENIKKEFIDQLNKYIA